MLDQYQCFEMLEGKKRSAMLPKSWNKSFNNGIVIPTKKRRCNECRGKILCVTFNNQSDENKESRASLNLLKRKAPNQFRHMLPYFLKKDDLFVIKTIQISVQFCYFLLKRFFI